MYTIYAVYAFCILNRMHFKGSNDSNNNACDTKVRDGKQSKGLTNWLLVVYHDEVKHINSVLRQKAPNQEYIKESNMRHTL